MKQSITLIFAAVIFFLPKSTFPQETTRILDRSSDPDEIAVFFYKSTTKAVDKLFVSENWNVGEISMSDGVLIKGFPIKYDLLSKRLEIRLNNEELVQTINRIEWFKMTSNETGEIEQFNRREDLKDEDGFVLEGICQLHSEGNYTLITNVFYTVKEPDYNSRLGTGSKEPSYYIKKKTYLCKDGIAYSKPANKKSKSIIFGSDLEKANMYIEQGKLNPKKRKDMLILVEYLNNNESDQ